MQILMMQGAMESAGDGDGDVPPQQVHIDHADEDVSDEDIALEDLHLRMEKDRVKLRRLQKKSINKRSTKYVNRRPRMSKAQNGVLKNMLEIMDRCNAQGFVYGIIPENGTPIGAVSDSLREWWNDIARFDRSGPEAILKHNMMTSAGCSSSVGAFEPTPHTLRQLSDQTLSSLANPVQNSALEDSEHFKFDWDDPLDDEFDVIDTNNPSVDPQVRQISPTHQLENDDVISVNTMNPQTNSTEFEQYPASESMSAGQYLASTTLGIGEKTPHDVTYSE